VIAVCGLLTLCLVVWLPRLTLDTSAQSFLRADDPVRVTFDAFNRQFQRNGRIMIALEPKEIFDLGFLGMLRSLHRELESLDLVQKVTSLINVRNTYGRGDELVVEDLLQKWPENAADLAALRARVYANPLYRNQLISEDRKLTTILVRLDTFSSLHPRKDVLQGFEDAPGDQAEFLTGKEQVAAIQSIRAVLKRYSGRGVPIYLTGAVAFDERLMTSMEHDIILTISLSGLVAALLLWALFRRLAAVLLPMAIVSLALVCSAGTMALVGIPFTLPLQILPSLLLAVGVCSAVHIQVLFFRFWSRGDSREDAIARALDHSGLPVLMAGLTTAGGLASFVMSELAPLGDFGLFGPLGVLFVMLFALVLLPSLLVVVPMRAPRPHAENRALLWIDRVLLGMGTLATRYPWSVVSVWAVCVAVAAMGTSRLYFSHDPIAWLPPGDSFREDTLRINRELHGSVTLEGLIDTNTENGLYDPELLRRVDALQKWSAMIRQGDIIVGKATSLVDILEETNQALHANRPEYHEIPKQRSLVAQELLLFENSGSDDLEDVVDPQFRRGSVTLSVPWVDGMRLAPFIDAVDQKFQEVLGDRARVTLTGGTVIFARTFAAVIRGMARSYVLALLIITPLMILLIGSMRGGLISMVPNITPIVLTLGLMGWLGDSLDFSTMMLGAIVLGVAVDDTIHFLHIFQRYYLVCGDPQQAVRDTLRTTGASHHLYVDRSCCEFLQLLLCEYGQSFQARAVHHCGRDRGLSGRCPAVRPHCSY